VDSSNLKQTDLLSNKDRLKKLLSKRKKEIFGEQQDMWSLERYENSLSQNHDENNHNTLYGYSSKSWLLPFFSSYSFKNCGEEEQYVAIMLNKFGCFLLSCSRALHIDVKHGAKNNVHHLGLCIRTEEIEGYDLDQVIFVGHCFMNKLSEISYREAFEQILNVLYENGVDTKELINEMEAITSDFSPSQNQGIKKAIERHSYEKNLNIDEEKVDNLLSGCIFHFKQSVARIKRVLRSSDAVKFEKQVELIMKSESKEEIKHQLDIIKNNYTLLRGWCQWWSAENIITLLLNSLKQREFNTNNTIECMNKYHFSKDETVVVNFKEFFDQQVKNYDDITGVLFSQRRIKYIMNSRKQRILKKLNARRKRRNYSDKPPESIRNL
jgi:hypothetical protein